MNEFITQVDRVEAALLTGRELTARQMVAMYGISSTDAARSVVSNVRQRGNAVYLNRHTDTKGRVTRKYRIGTPSKNLVAAGFRQG